MAITNSIAFPQMFDVARNKVAILEDNESIVNRDRLLILTEPTELFNNLDFGVGLKRHLFQYNNDNQKAIIQDRIKEQLRLHEPCCDPDKTSFVDGLLFTGDANTNATQEYNKLKMTVAISTVYNEIVNLDLDEVEEL